ncbi:MAG: endo-1,4-beta-xylanase [Verrucomicrobiales bacterium]|nr:endo-1,4-beta-xylanase [Verrucomicrobiales bacterium]
MNRSRIADPAFAALLAASILGIGIDAESADTPTLRDAFRDHFPVGTAVNRGMVTDTPSFRRTAEQNRADTALVRAQFNQITAENDMKWQLIHPREGPDGYDFGPADAFVEFGLRHQMQLVGHTLVWHSQTPNWVFAGTNPPPTSPADTAAAAVTTTNPPAASPPGPTTAPGGDRRRPGPGFGGFGRYTGPRASREELLGRMRDHIRTVVGRYRGRVRAWDVVNEALADGTGTNVFRNSLWFEIIGPDFVAEAFRCAHEADPTAILRYNDYGLENPAKRRRLITLIRSLREQGVPVHAIGSQAHVNLGTTFEAMDQALTEMETLGLPIHITELDVNAAEGGQRTTGADVTGNAATTQGGLVAEAQTRQAEVYAGLFRAFVKHRASVQMVTFWGANDAVSWRSAGRPLLFDGDNRPKPAFEAVLSEARRRNP